MPVQQFALVSKLDFPGLGRSPSYSERVSMGKREGEKLLKPKGNRPAQSAGDATAGPFLFKASRDEYFSPAAVVAGAQPIMLVLTVLLGSSVGVCSFREPACRALPMQHSKRYCPKAKSSRRAWSPLYRNLPSMTVQKRALEGQS